MSAVDEALASLDELDRRARLHDCEAALVAREVVGILREVVELVRPVALLDRIFRETDPARPRTARWEVLTRIVIGRQLADGPLMTRYRFLETPFGGLYLHHMHRPDADRDQHDHPWWFASLLLSGGYLEEYRPDRTATTRAYQAFTARARNCWDGPGLTTSARWRTFPLNASHRTTFVLKDTWSLVLVGPKRQDWGFWLPHAERHRIMRDLTCRGWACPPLMFVPWRTYTKGFQDEAEALTIL